MFWKTQLRNFGGGGETHTVWFVLLLWWWGALEGGAKRATASKRKRTALRTARVAHLFFCFAPFENPLPAPLLFDATTTTTPLICPPLPFFVRLLCLCLF
jgi:hypothetical protein